MKPKLSKSSSSSPTTTRRSHTSRNMRGSRSFDPFEAVLAPPRDETPEAQAARLTEERSAKERSQAIDKQLELEKKAKKRDGGREVKLLLLGPSEAGKTTYLRQLRIHHHRASLDAEREAFRLVIILGVVQSVRALLALLENGASNSGANTAGTASTPVGSSTSNRSRVPTPEAPGKKVRPDYLLLRMRLSPVLSIESELRERLGVVGGASSSSFAGRGDYVSFGAKNGPLSEHYGGPSGESTSASSPFSSGPAPIAETTNSDLDCLGYQTYAEDPNDKVGGMDDDRETLDDEKLSTNSGKKGSGRSRKASAVGWTRPKLPGYNTYILPSRWQASASFGSTLRRSKSMPRKLNTLFNEQKSNDSSPTEANSNEPDPIDLIVMFRDEIRALWNDNCALGNIAGEGPLQGRPGGFEVQESARYFLENLERIASKDYAPTDADIVNCRIKTIGVEEHEIPIANNMFYKVIDVAGARGQRNVWAQYFTDAAAIIFICSSAAYNEVLPEDPSVNRLHDAITLFHDIARNPLLTHSTLIVFLNKVDLLRRKLKSGVYPLSDYFPDYTGKESLEPVLHYFASIFKTELSAGPRGVNTQYLHFTTANDIKATKKTIATVDDLLLRRNLTQI